LCSEKKLIVRKEFLIGCENPGCAVSIQKQVSPPPGETYLRFEGPTVTPPINSLLNNLGLRVFRSTFLIYG
jgi:hypothetical protein